MASDELERFCGFAERFLTDEASRPLVIEPWQREILADYFAGTRELVTLVSKKNGKTSLFAGLALWHLITVAFADVAILAASRDQAGKLLSQLTGYIKRSSELRDQLRITQRLVHCDRTDGKAAVMAADSDTLDGWGGTLALVDELGRHRSEENFGLLRDGLGPRDGQLVAFSTAGDDEDSALGRIRSRAHDMPGFGPAPDNPKHKIGRADGFSFHEWSLDRGDDTDDLELVALANPASWLDADALRARKASPSMAEWQWQRFTCGLWVAGEDSALSATDWAACADPGAVIPDGADGVVVGGDLGYRIDTTAFVPAWRETSESPIILGKPIILTPPGDGGSISVEDMVAACLAYAERYRACSFSFDPKAGGEQLLQRLERELPDEHEFIEFPQMTGRLCGASMRFAELVGAGMIRHPADAEFTAHVLAASAKFIGERWRFGRPRGARKPIDALTAAMTAVDWLTSKPAPRRSRYSDPDASVVVA